MYYSTFLDGLQRVLLIIDDFTLAFRAQVVIFLLMQKILSNCSPALRCSLHLLIQTFCSSASNELSSWTFHLQWNSFFSSQYLHFTSTPSVRLAIKLVKLIFLTHWMFCIIYFSYQGTKGAPLTVHHFGTSGSWLVSCEQWKKYRGGIHRN